MRKEDKQKVIDSLVELLGQYDNFYLTDMEGLPADKTSELRRAAFKNGVKVVVAKNTLLKLALKEVNEEAYSPLFETLKGNTAVMFSETANAPAKLIKEFTKDARKAAAATGAPVRPELKSAYVQEGVYLGADKLEELVNVKSKEELLGDILLMLESPIQGVVSALESAAGGTIHGVLQTLEERGE